VIIDSHVHLGPKDLNGDKLVAMADKLGFDKMVIFNARSSGLPSYDDILNAAKRHPDRLIPFAFLDLGLHTVADVEKFSDQGFKGFKIIRPADDYNHPSYMPLYQAAEARGKIVLFHLGIVAVCEGDKENKVDTARMRPVFLDTICRQCPELVVWGAHLGNPWYEEAAMLCRWHKNLYFDITGSSLKAKEPEFFGKLFWWQGNKQYGDKFGLGPWDKILFGTDVSLDMMDDVHSDYKKLMDTLNLPQETRANIMGKTAARLLGLDE
jgi:uncharacterized protein